MTATEPLNEINVYRLTREERMKRNIAELPGSLAEALKLLEDTRDGETLSVRVGFKLDPDKHPFDFGDIGWWEFLELDEFNKIYPDQD